MWCSALLYGSSSGLYIYVFRLFPKEKHRFTYGSVSFRRKKSFREIQRSSSLNPPANAFTYVCGDHPLRSFTRNLLNLSVFFNAQSVIEHPPANMSTRRSPLGSALTMSFAIEFLLPMYGSPHDFLAIYTLH